MVKQYFRNTLKIEVDDSNFNRIHQKDKSMDVMMEKNVNKWLLSLKVLSPERKYGRYDLLIEARTRIKDLDSVKYPFADKHFSLALCLKMADLGFLISQKNWTWH